MENKQRSLQADLDSCRSELTSLHQEYDGYKVSSCGSQSGLWWSVPHNNLLSHQVRVHTVLKQQQTKAAVESALESERTEKEHLQEVLNQVKAKLQDTRY